MSGVVGSRGSPWIPPPELSRLRLATAPGACRSGRAVELCRVGRPRARVDSGASLSSSSVSEDLTKTDAACPRSRSCSSNDKSRDAPPAPALTHAPLGRPPASGLCCQLNERAGGSEHRVSEGGLSEMLRSWSGGIPIRCGGTITFSLGLAPETAESHVVILPASGGPAIGPSGARWCETVILNRVLRPRVLQYRMGGGACTHWPIRPGTPPRWPPSGSCRRDPGLSPRPAAIQGKTMP